MMIRFVRELEEIINNARKRMLSSDQLQDSRAGGCDAKAVLIPVNSKFNVRFCQPVQVSFFINLPFTADAAVHTPS